MKEQKKDEKRKEERNRKQDIILTNANKEKEEINK